MSQRVDSALKGDVSRMFSGGCVSIPLSCGCSALSLHPHTHQERAELFDDLLPQLQLIKEPVTIQDMYTEHLTARTFFSDLSVFVVLCICQAVVTTFSHAHTCVRIEQTQVEQVKRIACTRSLKAFHPHAMSPLNIPSTSSICSTPPPTWTPSPATLTGSRPNPCAPHRIGQSGTSGRSHATHRL